MALGVSTMPTVTVFASSGVRESLPLETRRVLPVVPPVSRSRNPVDETPAGWNRSLRLGARISDEYVLRIRSVSLTRQFNPVFQDSTDSKFSYLVQRPARFAESSWKPGTSLSSGTLNSSAPS